MEDLKNQSEATDNQASEPNTSETPSMESLPMNEAEMPVSNESEAAEAVQTTEENGAIAASENDASPAPATSTAEEQKEEEDHQEVLESEDEDTNELPDFVSMGTEELVKLAASLIKEKDVSQLRPFMEGIKSEVIPRFDALYKENLQLFVEQGGNAIDFHFSNPLRDEFRKHYQEYQGKRREYYQLLERQLETNLHKKRQLVEELKQLLQKEESIKESFKELRSIQERWNNVGPVPKSDSDDLWKTYHFHLDNFYDYVKLNDDLRDLDFKHNKEEKEKISREAESLAELDSIGEAMARLQSLHKRWKEIGPVERELREPLWERFSKATQVLHEQRDAWRAEMAQRDEERIEGKRVIVGQMEAFLESAKALQKHPEWQKATEEMEAMFDAFKKLGRINHPENDPLWQSAKQAFRQFLHIKNEHYKEVKKEHKANLERKEALVEKARALKDSDNWRDTSNELKRLQEEWKNIGLTSRKDGDRVWKEFRQACDHFFQRMKEDRKVFKGQQKELADKKTQAIDALEALIAQSEGLSKKVLLEHAKAYRAIGRLSREFSKVDERFEEVLQSGFDKLKIGRVEAAQMQFAQKLETLSEQGDGRGINREEQNIRKQLEEAQKEVQQLENNIQFFRSSKGTNPLIQQVERKIEREKERVLTLRQQLKALRQAKD